eukprot:TRINITY_DN4159_c0_g1_i1.p1 TRINITY_DN4159_c0_g1~~TRINITY_DN4159_c0_g1_i1.p1  ORF type:complete len:1572 (-),score=514.42 TRINITY_DN4159_c0_g1_i1:25-4740(-)
MCCKGRELLCDVLLHQSVATKQGGPVPSAPSALHFNFSFFNNMKRSISSIILLLSLLIVSLSMFGNAETSTEDQSFLDVVSDSEMESDDDQLQDDQDDALHELSIQEGYSDNREDILADSDQDEFAFDSFSAGEQSEQDHSGESSDEVQDDSGSETSPHFKAFRSTNSHLRASKNLMGRNMQYMASLKDLNGNRYSTRSLKKQARRTRMAKAQLKKFNKEALASAAKKIGSLRSRYGSIRSRCRGLQLVQRRLVARMGDLRRQLASITAQTTASAQPAAEKSSSSTKLSPKKRLALLSRKRTLQARLNRLTRRAGTHARRLVTLKDRKYRMSVRLNKKRAAVAARISEGKMGRWGKTHKIWKKSAEYQTRVSRAMTKLHGLRKLRKQYNIARDAKVNHSMHKDLAAMHKIASTRLATAAVSVDEATKRYRQAIDRFRSQARTRTNAKALKSDIRTIRDEVQEKQQLRDDLAAQVRSLKRSLSFRKRWLAANRKLQLLTSRRHKLRQSVQRARQSMQQSQNAINGVVNTTSARPRLSQLRANLHKVQNLSLSVKNHWTRYLARKSRLRVQERHCNRMTRERNIAREQMLRWERRRLLEHRSQIAKRRWNLSRKLRLMRGQLKSVGGATKSGASKPNVTDEDYELTRDIATIRERMTNIKSKLRVANRELSSVIKSQSVTDSRLRRARLSRRKLRVNEAKRVTKQIGHTVSQDRVKLGALLLKQYQLSRALLNDMVATRREVDQGPAYAPTARHALRRLVIVGRMAHRVRRRRAMLHRIMAQTRQQKMRITDARLRLMNQDLLASTVKGDYLLSKERQKRHTAIRYQDHVDRLMARLVLAKQRNQTQSANRWRRKIAAAKKRLARYNGQRIRANQRHKQQVARTRDMYKRFQSRVKNIQTDSQQRLVRCNTRVAKLDKRRKIEAQKLVKVCTLGGALGADCRKSKFPERLRKTQAKFASATQQVGQLLARHAFSQSMLNNYKLSLFKRLYGQQNRAGDRTAKRLARYSANVERLSKRVKQLRTRGSSQPSSKGHRSRQQVLLVANTRKLVEAQRRMVDSNRRLADITRHMAIIKQLEPQMKTLKKSLVSEQKQEATTDPKRLLDLRLSQLHQQIASKMQNRRSRWNALRRRMMRIRQQRKDTTLRIAEQKDVLNAMHNAIRTTKSVTDAASGLSAIRVQKDEVKELRAERGQLRTQEKSLARRCHKYNQGFWRSRSRFLESTDMQMRWMRFKVKEAGRENNRAFGLANRVYSRGIQSLIGKGSASESQLEAYKRSVAQFLTLKKAGFYSLARVNRLQSQYAGLRSDLHRVMQDGNRIAKEDLARSQRRLAREQNKLTKAQTRALKQQHVVQQRARVTKNLQNDVMDDASGSRSLRRNAKQARILLLGSKERLIRRRRRVICLKMKVRRLQEQVVQRRAVTIKQDMEMMEQLKVEENRAESRAVKSAKLLKRKAAQLQSLGLSKSKLRTQLGEVVHKTQKNGKRAQLLKSRVQKWKQRVVEGMSVLQSIRHDGPKQVGELKKLAVERRLLDKEEALAKLMRDKESGMNVSKKTLGRRQKEVREWRMALKKVEME